MTRVVMLSGDESALRRRALAETLTAAGIAADVGLDRGDIVRRAERRLDLVGVRHRSRRRRSHLHARDECRTGRVVVIARRNGSGMGRASRRRRCSTRCDARQR